MYAKAKKKKKNFPHFHPLVRFLPVCSTWSWPTVIGLDDECVFLLQLTVNGTPCSKPTFSRCLVQHNGFEGHFLPMDFKSTNFTCEEQHKTIITGVGGEGVGLSLMHWSDTCEVHLYFTCCSRRRKCRLGHQVTVYPKGPLIRCLRSEMCWVQLQAHSSPFLHQY